MTTSELCAQYEDVTHTMTKAKRPASADKKNEVEKKKKKKKKKENKTQKDGHKEEIESETELCAKKDEEMQMQKKKKAKLSEDGSDKKNVEKKKKKKKKKKKENKTQKDEHKEDIESETELCAKKDEEMEMQKKEKAKLSEDGSDKRNVEKKKKKKKKKKENKTLKDEHKEDIESETELCAKKDEEMQMQKKEKAKLSEDGSDKKNEVEKKKKKKKKENKTQKDEHKEEIESETELCAKKDEEMQMQKKEKAKLSEGLDRKNRKRGSESGKEKKNKKQKTEKVHEAGAEWRENVDFACPSERLSPKGSSKKVKFSDDVEIFPLANDQSSGKTKKDDGLIRGKRFSKEEDEMVKKAVLEYIEVQALGDEGLKKVLHCREFPEVKNCWKDIGKALPWRPYLSIYYRAHILFERDEKRKWTPEEYELVRKFHDKHGSDWKILADALGKHRFHVKDTWRRIKLPNMKKGQWTQDEYQKLFDLVNTDLRLKAFEEKKSKHGMLRDNICWGAISDKLSTRSTALCCQKWYRQLTSPMVAEDEWADVDDYRLLDALSSLDAYSIEDVEWDHVLEHRNGDVCRKRWSQMVKHIGDHGNQSFSEQVEVLSKRYSIDVLDAREAYDNSPIVD